MGWQIKDKNKPVEERRVFIVNTRESFEIPLSVFLQNDLTLWLFLDQREPYLELLDKFYESNKDFFKRQNLARAWPVYLSTNSERNFANQGWLGGLDGRSYFGGYCRYLHYCCRSRGVLSSGGVVEGRARETGEEKVYIPSPKEIQKALRVIQEVKGGIKGTKTLDELTEFLQRFKR